MSLKPDSLRPFLAVYAVALFALFVDLILISRMPQGIQWANAWTGEFIASAILIGVGVLLLRRKHVRFAAACFAFASVIALATVNMLAHLAPAYIGRDLPLIDELLRRADETIGFDWIAYFMWHADHPTFAAACRLAYLACGYMPLLIVALLAMFGELERLCRLLIATSLSLIVVYLASIVTPSYGAYVQHGMTPSMHPDFPVQFANIRPAYDALRAGIVDI